MSFDGGATFTPVTVNPDGSINLVVPANTSSVTLKVPTTDDTISEGAETIKLTAGTPANGATPVEGTGTINDNDGTPTLSIEGPVTVNEAAGTLTYTVKLSNPSATGVTVNYATQDGTANAGSDYTQATGSLTFAPGETTKTITVNVLDDSVFEGSEAFKVVLSNATGAAIAMPEATTTIKDDGTGTTPPGVPPTDDTPKVSGVSSPSTTEGGDLSFKVDLSNPSTTTTPLTLKLTDGSGTVAGDTTGPVSVSFDGGVTFTPVTVNPDGTINLVVPANTSSVTLKVPTTDDTISEGAETIKLTAGTPANGATPVEGTGTINDNDGTPTLSIEGPVTVNEAAGTLTYTVKLSNPSATGVTVNYATQDGTANAGSDYTQASGSLTFAPGETTKTITVNVQDDTVFEGSEAFKVVLSNATGAGIAIPEATTTIKDDGTGTTPPGVPPTDDTPKVSGVSSPSTTEGGDLSFKVDLSNPSTTTTPSDAQADRWLRHGRWRHDGSLSR